MSVQAITEQLAWIADHGGDLEGYRRHYSLLARQNPTTAQITLYEQADSIYFADINYLRLLQGHPTFLIEHDEAVRVLGEDYYA